MGFTVKDLEAAISQIECSTQPAHRYYFWSKSTGVALSKAIKFFRDDPSVVVVNTNNGRKYIQGKILDDENK